MPASTYLGNALINDILRGVDFANPTTIYISLHTGDPGLNGANEVGTGAWPSYARKDAAGGGAIATGWAAAASKATANALDVDFGANDGAGTVTVTHFGVWDHPTAGNFLFGDALTASKAYAPTDEAVLHDGDLDVAID
jgi:hypothetical protein